MTDDIDALIRIADGISRDQIPAWQHNECFTVGAFDALIMHASPEQAFRMLQALCVRFHEVERADVVPTGYFLLLATLARQGKTTEMPEGMLEIIRTFPSLAGELRTWYRLPG